MRIEVGCLAPSESKVNDMLVMKNTNPRIAVVPYLSTGVTDSARLRRLGVQAYGILPFPMAQSDEERMHGNDERVPLTSLHFGTRLIFGAISRIAF